ncbi:hypothetical protein E5676_scaffold84172G00030 [Cucumis melo var. makuwa]|uniref:Uncharacterized protein n=1 Tax=Cucumis melo var. makuwa TaxID=1194695 RepID=A0A5A7SW92_CUCMM|nr:hypothetical protein E6C27_scaffold48914G00020 [Cucumis melo var. makuwa]TYJ96715.1 hypothetical protein E5676_scaffold84172G00030 [Cucumis melo var. makuwa]
MGVSLAARKHPVLTTLRETKAQVTPVGEVALSIPSGQPGRERGGNGLPKKPARGRSQHRMKGTTSCVGKANFLGFGRRRADMGTRVRAQRN